MKNPIRRLAFTALISGLLIWFWYFNVHPTPTYRTHNVLAGDRISLWTQRGFICGLGFTAPENYQPRAETRITFKLSSRQENERIEFDLISDDIEIVPRGKGPPDQVRYRIRNSQELFKGIHRHQSIQISNIPEEVSLELWSSDGRGLIPSIINPNPIKVSSGIAEN